MSGQQPPKLDPNTLYNEQEKRDTLRLKTYNSILEQVHNKIKIIARLPKNDKTLLFTVPEFVLGVPRFSQRDCILYIVWNLRNSKFAVQYFQPNLLYISWQKQEQQYKEERSPIVQIMKNAIEQPKSNTFEDIPKPVLKKTTTQYLTPLPSSDNVKKVTFI